MSDFEALVQGHLQASQRKAEILDAKTKEKANYLDPDFSFGVDEVRFIDQDTVELPNGETLRLSGGEGRTLDAYETSPDRYVDNPDVFQRHKYNYAKAYGLDPNDVTMQDLTMAGQSQARKAQERLASMADENGRIRYKRRGSDDYGRTIAQLDENQINLSGRQDNAEYYSQYNYQQGMEDFASGEWGKQLQGAGGRSIQRGAGDQLVNLVGGAGRMVNELAQSAGVLTGANLIPGVDEGHDLIRSGLDKFKEALLSPQQQRRERLEGERRQLASEFYNVQKEKYMEKGSSELNASIRAGIDEFVDAAGNIIDNPGAVLDKTVESLPYMLGVAGAGRAATKKAISSLQKEILKRSGVQKNITKGLKRKGLTGTKGKIQSAKALEDTAAAHTQLFINSTKGQKYLQRVQRNTGIGTVGLTEGLSTSAEVYDSIINMSEEDAMNSDKYVAMRQEGRSHEYAVRQLAEDAHLQTLLTVTLAAGAAAGVTGAGAWEASLLTGLKKIKKPGLKLTEAQAKKAAAAKAAKEAKKGLTRKGLEKTAKGVGAVGKFVGPSTGKEAIEEGLQSGGGEFLSQLASFEATGEQVGPGVGAAAGEGAVIGAAAGGGVQATLGLLKEVATINPKKALAAAKSKLGKEVEAKNIKPAVVPKGQAPTKISEENAEKIDQPGFEGTPDEQFQNVIDNFVENMDVDNSGVGTLATWDTLNQIKTKANQTGSPISEENEATLRDLIEPAARAVVEENVAAIEKKDPESLGAEDLALLRVASLLGVKFDKKRLTKEQSDLIDASVKLEESFDALDAYLDEAIETNPEQESEIRRVHAGKFGPGMTKVGKSLKPGLGWYKRKLAEAFNSQTFTTEDKSLNKIFKDLEKFRVSQEKRLAKVAEHVENKTSDSTFTYTEPDPQNNKGGSPALLEVMQKEQVEFEAAIQEMQNMWSAWKAASAKATPQETAQPTSEAESAPKKPSKASSARKTTKRAPRKPGPSKALRTQYREWRKLNVTDKAERIKKLQDLREQAINAGDTDLAKSLNRALEGLGEAGIDVETQPKPKTTKKGPSKAVKEALKELNADIKEKKLSREEVGNIAKIAGIDIEGKTYGQVKLELAAKRLNQKANKASAAKKAKKAETSETPETSETSETSEPTETREEFESRRKAELDKMISRDIVNIATELGIEVPGTVVIDDLQQEIIEKELEQVQLDEETLFHGTTNIPGIIDDEGAPATQPTAAAGAPTTIRQAMREGGVQGTLQFIAEKSKTLHAPALAKRLLEVIGDRKINVIHLDQAGMEERFPGRGRARGAWVPSEQTIYLNTTRLDSGFKYQNTFMHEVTHAGINGWLRSNPKHKLAKELRQLNLEIRLRLKSASQAKGDEADIMNNLLKDPEELLTHGLNNPFLQKFLQNTKYKKETLWSKFVATIAKALGLTDNTALHRVLSLTDRIFNEANPPTKPTSEVKAKAAAQAKPQQQAAGVVTPKSNEELFTEIEEDRGIFEPGPNGISFRQATLSREEFIAKWGWTVPTRANLNSILEALNGRSVVMPAAGMGLWAALLRNAGVTVYASDQNPGVSDYDQKKRDTFTTVEKSDAVDAVKAAPKDAVLFLSWPEQPSKPGFVAETLDAYKGSEIIYVGNLDNTLSLRPASLDKLNEQGYNTQVEAISYPDNYSGFDDEIYHLTSPSRAAEQQAEVAKPTLSEEGQRIDRALRISEVRRMRTLIANETITEPRLTKAEDQAFLDNLLEAGIPLVEATEQLIANIEPNPEARNVKISTTIDQEIIDKVANDGALLNHRESPELVDARPIPTRWRDFTDFVTGQVTRVAKLFESFKLPLKIADAVKIRNRKVNDLLASDDFVMTVLTDPGARDQFFDKIGATPAEQLALTSFAQFYQGFYNRLASNIRKIKPEDIQNQQESGNGIGAIAEHLLPYFTDDDGNLDHNIAAAMALESLQWLVTKGPQTISNNFDDIRGILGLPDNAYVTKEMQAAVGQGTIRTNVTAEIGYKALAHSNLAALPDAKPLILEQFALAMGAQSLATLADMRIGGNPLIKMHAIERAHWNKMTGKDINTKSGPVMMVRNNSTQPAYDENLGRWPRVDVNMLLRERVQDGRGIFAKLFGSTSNVRTPVFEKPELKDVPKKVSRSMANIPEEMRKRMLNDMQKGYEMDTEVMDLILSLPENWYLQHAHGWTTDAEMETKHVQERDGLQGKNDGLVRDFIEAQRWRERYGSKRFFLPQKMIRSGRVYIDSNVINPQANKLHRFMFIRDGWKKSIKKQRTGEAYEDFMTAVGLGIGIKIANFEKSEIVNQVEEFFAKGKGKAALEALQKEERTAKDLEALAAVVQAEGTHTIAALHAYSKWDKAKPGESVEIALPTESDGTTNGYIIGLLQTPPVSITPDYKKLLNAGGVFFEGDEFQNWAAYKAAGGLDNYQHVAKGTRKFIEDNRQEATDTTVTKKMENTTKRGIFLWRTVDRVWASRLVPSLDDLLDKVGRDWAKDPLMVTSYGAGFPSVKRAMVSKAVETFYANLAAARNGTVEEITAAINSAYSLANLWVDTNNAAGVKHPVWIQGQKTWVPYERVGNKETGLLSTEQVLKGAEEVYEGSLQDLALNFKLPRDVEAYMGRTLTETYGQALEQSLTERLAPVLEIRKLMNGANQYSNIIYDEDFKRRVRILEHDKGNKLTPADKRRIREQMMREGLVPSIRTPASEGLQDSLETTVYQNEYYKVGDKLLGGKARLEDARQLTEAEYSSAKKPTIPAPARSLSARMTAPVPSTEVGVASGVRATHAADGVGNSLVWGDSKYAVGNIHDAQLSPWWAASDVAGQANGVFGTMHASYEMPDQFLRTMLRMHASLMSANDARFLSYEMNNVYRAMGEVAAGQHSPVGINWEREGINPTDNPVEAGQILVEVLLEQLQYDVAGSRAGKAELFKSIRSIEQFAMPGSAASFPEGIELNTANSWHLSERMSAKQLTELMREYLATPTQEAAINWFRGVIENPEGQVKEAFLSYLEHSNTDAMSAMDLLANSYDGAFGNQLKLLNNIIRPYLSTVRVTVMPEGTSFSNRSTTISVGRDSANPISDFLHGALFAAALPQLEEMKVNDPEGFATLSDRAFNTARNWMKSDKPGVAKVGSEIIRYHQHGFEAAGIAAFLGRSLSAPNTNDLHQLVAHFTKEPGNFSAYSENLQRALRAGKASSTVLFDEAMNDEAFESRYSALLESEKVVKIFEDLSLIEETAEDPAHQEHLNNVVETLVVPGLKSIEPVMQVVQRDNEATTHTGETIQDVATGGHVILLKAAGNALTNNVDASLQERAANEYVHNIVSHAVDTDHFVRKEARRLFEIAENALTWRDLMPAEIVGDPAIAEARAQERYNWIFNNPDPNMGYKAFISVGTTNAQFATALSNIDNPSASFITPTWDRGILRAMMSLVRQAVALLSGVGARAEGGTLKDATMALGMSSVAANQRNQQRLKELADGPTGSKISRMNQGLVNAVNSRIVEPLGKGLSAINEKRLDPENPTLPGFVKAATYAAMSTKNSEVRAEYNKFYRAVADDRFGKDNSFFEILSEITPWNEDKLQWIDILRKSKYMVDMARQEATEHTRSFIMDSFDPNNYMDQLTKRAMTKNVLRTDLPALLQGEHGIKIPDLVPLLEDMSKVDGEIRRLEALLKTRLGAENLTDRFAYFQTQYQNLGMVMAKGKFPVAHQMLNAHNIVEQFFLPKFAQKKVSDPEVVNLVDSLASLHALKLQEPADLLKTVAVAKHELSRTDTEDDGFSRLVGMVNDFKLLSKENLFKNNPVQMRKGYVYELFDGDVNIAYVQDGSPEQAEAEAKGMVRVAALEKDPNDNSPVRYLYKGLQGLASYNKAAVSLTDIQHAGSNLFSIAGYRSDDANRRLGKMRTASFNEAVRQNRASTSSNNHTVPILDDQGNIVDYRYMMSEMTKEQVLKKQDPFDRVLPHMFGSLKDRRATVDINRRIVDLLKEEHDGLKNNREYRFVEIGANSEDQATKDQWFLLPEDMRRYAEKTFGSKKIIIRDDIIPMVLGFRKLTVSNSRPWGEATPAVRMADKVWLETVSLMRIKIAVLTPVVVIGNIISNLGMLITEGIPFDFIRKNTDEAISAMRQYQKDRKAATELEREIGSLSARGKDTKTLERKLGRLEADLQMNPVGKLVEEGLFTSIASDLGVDDDTVRGSLLTKLEDAAKGQVGSKIVRGVKELYMLPGSTGYKAAVAATQYGDFVARYIKVKYDTTVLGVEPDVAFKDALAKFIYYDLPQNKYLQAANDYGPMMFTKFFGRIQSIVAKMYSQNPISATGVLMFQRGLMPQPFDENIANYGLGEGGLSKITAPWNLPGKVYDTLNPGNPALWQILQSPLGL